jgi:hypothetical protein
MEKIMYRKKKINNTYSKPVLARPQNLRQAKALCNNGFSVKPLTQDLKKKYLEIIEMEIEEFCSTYSWRYLPSGCAIDGSVGVIMNEFAKYGTVWISAMRDCDSYIVPRAELDECFEATIAQANPSILRENIDLYIHNY